MGDQIRVAILLFDGFDLLDVGGPYEVLLTAGRLLERDGQANPVSVELVSPVGADARAYGGMTVTGLAPVDAADGADIVVVPGTIDLDAVMADGATADAIRALTSGGPLVTSVCTGSVLLARAGVLGDRPATTHWEDLGLLADAGVTDVGAGVRWVDDGDVVTSAGLISGVHMGLHLVHRLLGEDLARRTARQIDVDWSPDPAMR